MSSEMYNLFQIHLWTLILYEGSLKDILKNDFILMIQFLRPRVYQQNITPFFKARNSFQRAIRHFQFHHKSITQIIFVSFQIYFTGFIQLSTTMPQLKQFFMLFLKIKCEIRQHFGMAQISVDGPYIWSNGFLAEVSTSMK